MARVRVLASLPLLALAITIGGCSPGGDTSVASETPSPTNAGHAPAAQDIPDTQVYLDYKGTGFVIKYPEGWTQTVTSDGIVFNNLDSRISVSVRSGSVPDVATATAQAQSMTGETVTTPPRAITMPGGLAVAYQFESTGSPDPVTGKSASLATDRYEVAGPAGGGHFAVIDLSSPVGVDNIDAFRLISQSFAWR